ncbi:MAG: Ig-like domain-containing protein [Gemmatimonas sp.]
MFNFARARAFLIVAFAVSVSACGGGDSGGTTTQPGPAANVGISSTAFTFVAIGASQAVTAAVTDAKGNTVSNAPLTWSSDDATVAEVQASGRQATIVARKIGSTTIHASSGGASATIDIIVLGVKSVAVSSAAITLRSGNQETISATVSTDAGVSRSVNWSSSNVAIATISPQGVITGVAPGVATVTASAVADAGMTAASQITVLPARGVAILPAAASIGTSTTKQLTADVIVDAGVPTTVTWATSAASVATVSQQGLVTGVALGVATITATSTEDNSLQGVATITVAPIVRLVAITPPANSSLFLGQTLALVAVVTADAGASQAVIWSSSNTAIATVNGSGVVTTVSAGTVSITATSAEDPSRNASVSLTAVSRPLTITLSAPALTVTAGNSATIVATVLADPGVSTAVNWTSSAPSVATVNNGVVTGVTNGAAVVTATSVADPTKSAALAVSVGARLANSWTTTQLSGPMIENIVSTYVATANNAFAVNSRGDIFRYNGANWSRAVQGSAFGTTFLAVHGSSGTNVVAVGTGGKILTWNGTTWQAASSNTNADLRDVWVESATSAFAVGGNGVAVRLTGTTWAVTTTPALGETLNAVWAAGNNGWFAVGTNGTLLRFNNGTWTKSTSPTSVNLRDVFGNANNDVYAVGEVGTVLWFNGGAWSVIPSNFVSSDLYSVSGTTVGGGARIFIGGDRVSLQLVNGMLDAMPNDPPYSVQFLSMSVDANGVLWMGGERGLMLRYSGSIWETMNIAPDLIDVWSTGVNNSWAVGEFGFIYRYDGTQWSRQNSPTLTRLNTVWGSSSSVAFAGGDVGMILRYDGTNWTSMASPTSSDILSMWGSGPTNVYATTYDGEVLRYNGTAWSIVSTQTNPLYAVYGSSASDVYAAGDAGTMLRFNGTSWSPMSTGSSALLAGVWSSASNNVFTVGVQGSAAASLRYITSWSPFSVGISAELTSVWGPTATDLYVSGASGTILRYDGSAWQGMPTGTTEYLWAVTGDPAGLGGGFAVGFNSTLVTGLGPAAIGASRVASRLYSGGSAASLAPSRAALQSRTVVRSLPQGTARRSARMSHSPTIRGSARAPNAKR